MVFRCICLFSFIWAAVTLLEFDILHEWMATGKIIVIAEVPRCIFDFQWILEWRTTLFAMYSEWETNYPTLLDIIENNYTNTQLTNIPILQYIKTVASYFRWKFSYCRFIVVVVGVFLYIFFSLFFFCFVVQPFHFHRFNQPIVFCIVNSLAHGAWNKNEKKKIFNEIESSK